MLHRLLKAVHVHHIVSSSSVGGLRFLGTQVGIESTLSVGSDESVFDLLLLELLEGCGARDDVFEELEVLNAGNCICCRGFSRM